MIELSLRQNFALWLPVGVVLRGWARSASGDTAEGISWIDDGIDDYRATGSILTIPLSLTLKAEALHLADRTSEALEAIKEAEALVERSEGRVSRLRFDSGHVSSLICSKEHINKPSRSQRSFFSGLCL